VKDAYIMGAEVSMLSDLSDLATPRRQAPAFDNDRLACAPTTRRRFPRGRHAAPRPLEPEATGALIEATKWLKPSVAHVTYW
jgi:hypothetical protein